MSQLEEHAYALRVPSETWGRFVEYVRSLPTPPGYRQRSVNQQIVLLIEECLTKMGKRQRVKRGA